MEIGTGNGVEGVMFALNGADYTGVDLTEAALEATRKHFEVMGLRGMFRKENAEHLSFPDESFDWVFSHWVLHHTPNPPASAQWSPSRAEARRPRHHHALPQAQL